MYAKALQNLSRGLHIQRAGAASGAEVLLLCAEVPLWAASVLQHVRVPLQQLGAVADAYKRATVPLQQPVQHRLCCQVEGAGRLHAAAPFIQSGLCLSAFKPAGVRRGRSRVVTTSRHSVRAKLLRSEWVTSYDPGAIQRE